MTQNQSEVVKLILAGLEPVTAVSQVYKIAPGSAQKRLTRVLKHWAVYAGLQASTVRTATHTRRLMADVWISPRYAPADPEAGKASVRDRLRSLLYEGAAKDFTPAQWSALAADVKSTGFLGEWSKTSDRSDYFLMSHALCEQELADGRAGNKPHPQWDIPRDWMDRADIQDEDPAPPTGWAERRSL